MANQNVAIHPREVALEGCVTEAEERFINFIENVDWKFQFFGENLTPEELNKLVQKLDQLRGESTLSFSSSREAIDYLRSIVRRK